MSKFMDSPCEGYGGNPGDLGGSGGSGKPYDDKFQGPTEGGVIPFKGLENVKGDEGKINILTPANKGH